MVVVSLVSAREFLICDYYNPVQFVPFGSHHDAHDAHSARNAIRILAPKVESRAAGGPAAMGNKRSRGAQARNGALGLACSGRCS